MTQKGKYDLLNYATAGIWLINGLFCKLLNLVPRHQQIIASILGDKYSTLFRFLIGIAEVLMALWILSRIQPRVNAIAQIIIIASMNITEYVLVPHLLLWGKFNSLFALLLIGVIWYSEFHLHKRIKPK